jgi:hypothetical protein
MNKTFDELGYKAGDTVRCAYTRPSSCAAYKAGDIFELSRNRDGYLSIPRGFFGNLGDWVLVCDPSVLTWGDMTPEQQGALLLAHHQGKTIEMLLVYSKVWHTLTGKPEFQPEYAYRIKPEPVVVHHEMHNRVHDGKLESFTKGKHFTSTYVLTYDTEDGVPVCSSVKLSKLT